MLMTCHFCTHYPQAVVETKTEMYLSSQPIWNRSLEVDAYQYFNLKITSYQPSQFVLLPNKNGLRNRCGSLLNINSFVKEFHEPKMSNLVVH